MRIDAHEYLQIGYDPIIFESVHRDDLKRVNKTAVDPNPKQNRYWNPKGEQGGQLHHVYLESFIQFARYIPNKYDVIHFTRDATEYELTLAKRLLNEGGEIII